MWDIAFGPRGRLYSVAFDNSLRVWDPKMGRLLDRFRVDGGPKCLAIVDGRFWVGCEDGSCCLFEIE